MSIEVMAIHNARIDAADGPTWGETLHTWVTSVDHKRIGLLYILFALLFLVVAGVAQHPSLHEQRFGIVLNVQGVKPLDPLEHIGGALVQPRHQELAP